MKLVFPKQKLLILSLHAQKISYLVLSDASLLASIFSISVDHVCILYPHIPQNCTCRRLFSNGQILLLCSVSAAKLAWFFWVEGAEHLEPTRAAYTRMSCYRLGQGLWKWQGWGWGQDPTIHDSEDPLGQSSTYKTVVPVVQLQGKRCVPYPMPSQCWCYIGPWTRSWREYVLQWN